jgi:nucleoside-diphosphate-sugar epimerase
VKKTLIVGCGYLGSYLKLILEKNKIKVSAIKRTYPKLGKQNNFIYCDVSKEFSLEQKFDHIIYMISAASFTKEAYEKAYVKGLVSTIKTIKNSGNLQTQLIFISTTGVYPQKEAELVDESYSIESTLFPSNVLAEAEQIVKNSGIKYTILRSSGIYGPERGYLIDAVKGKKICFYKKNNIYTNRVHVYDLANIIYFSLDNKDCLNTTINASDCHPASNNEVLSWFIDKLKLARADYKTLVEKTEFKRGNKRCSNAKLLSLGFRFKYPSFKEGYEELLTQR